MRLNYSKNTNSKTKKRIKNKVKIRKKVSGTAERPRLSVYRSNANIYAQIIDDVAGKTLVAASTLNTKVEGGSSNVAAAKAIGEKIAKLAAEKSINNVVFDRSGYVYHGKIKALADGAREAGLNF